MITLAEAKVGMADMVDQNVIDEFRRGSQILDLLTFDDSVSPGTGGSTLTYSYQMLKTPSTAAFRAINAEYAKKDNAIREKKSTELKIFGGTFPIDRVIAKTSGAVDEVNFQLQEKIKATINLFHYCAINGDDSVTGFDGLDVMLAGSSTEINTGAQNAIDISTAAALDTNYKAVLDMLDAFLAELDGKPDLLMANTKLITKLQACARRSGYLTQSEDAFGRKAFGYNGVLFQDLQYYFDGSATKPVVPIVTRNNGATPVTGLTDLYAARFALDGFHAASPAGGKVIDTNLPDFTTAGAVKEGDVEMVAGLALKKSRAAGVLRNFKVQ